MSQSYHNSIPVQSKSRTTAAKTTVVHPVFAAILSEVSREFSIDALGAPAIASTCQMCGEGFTDKDLAELEWDANYPCHRDCYLQYVDERNQFSDMLEEMRGA